MVHSLKNRLYFFALFGRGEHEAQEAELELETRTTRDPVATHATREGEPPSRVSRVPC